MKRNKLKQNDTHLKLIKTYTKKSIQVLKNSKKKSRSIRSLYEHLLGFKKETF